MDELGDGTVFFPIAPADDPGEQCLTVHPPAGSATSSADTVSAAESESTELAGRGSSVKDGGKRKRYKCDYCSYRAHSGTDVQKHTRAKHTKERPYSCAKCGRRFADRSNRNQHERNIHNFRHPAARGKRS